MILQVSVPRTGSTLVYRVLCDLFDEDDVLKTHTFRSYLNHSSPSVITYRDPCAIASSYWRIDILRILKEKININLIPPGRKVDVSKRDVLEHSINYPKLNRKDFAKRYITMVKWDFSGMEKFQKQNKGKQLYLRYEDFWDDYNTIYNNLETFFDISISDSQRERMTEQYGLESSKAIQKKMISFTELDEKTGLHGDHIGTPYPEEWKRNVTEEIKLFLEERLHEIRKKWAYV